MANKRSAEHDIDYLDILNSNGNETMRKIAQKTNSSDKASYFKNKAEVLQVKNLLQEHDKLLEKKIKV